MSKEVETRAILGALIKAKEKGVKQVQVLSDANEVIQAFKGGKDWTLGPIALDISKLSGTFNKISFSYVPHSLNEGALQLAKIFFFLQL